MADPFLGLKNDYTDFPPTIVGSADLNLRANALINLVKVLLKYTNVNGILKNETDRCVFDQSTKRIAAPGVDGSIIGIVGGIPMLMDYGMEKSSSVASASTTTITDTTLAEADDYWVNAYVIMTSGAADGDVRKVTAFDGTLHRLTVESAFSAAPSAADTYVVTFFHVTNLTNDATNYIYAEVGSDSVNRGIMTFTASTSATPADGQIMVSSAVLDGSGVVTSVDDAYSDVKRGLYPNQGGYDVLSGTGTTTEIAASATLDIDITHTQLLYAGGITCVITDGVGGTIEPIAYWGDSGFTLRVTNTSGSPDTYSYSWTRTGRRLEYAV